MRDFCCKLERNVGLVAFVVSPGYFKIVGRWRTSWQQMRMVPHSPISPNQMQVQPGLQQHSKAARTPLFTPYQILCACVWRTAVHACNRSATATVFLRSFFCILPEGCISCI